MRARLRTFWFKVWGILIPVIVTVFGLIIHLLQNKYVFVVTGMEYVLGETLLVLGPLVLLRFIIKDSLTLLYARRVCTNANLVVKVVGSQWYWNYEVRDIEEVIFTSYIKRREDLMVGEIRFLEVDNRLVLPVSIKIQLNITSRDVIHSFALPTLGVKGDATAGILNVVGVTINKVGTHYGQCSEICGINHRYMPIVVESTLFINFYYWIVSHL